MNDRSERKGWRLVLVTSIITAFVAFGCMTAFLKFYDSWRVSRMKSALSSSDKTVRYQACEFLENRNINTTSLLTPLLQHENKDVREFAVVELNQHIPIQRPVIEAFLKVAVNEEEDLRIRWWTIYTFGQIGEQVHGPVTESESRIVNTLGKLLKSPTPEVSIYAVDSLLNFKKRAVPSRIKLYEALDSESDLLRMGAAATLMNIDAENRETLLPILIKGLQQQDNEARRKAVYLLGTLRTDADTVIPALKDFVLQNPDWSYEVDEAITRIQTVK